MTRLKNFIKEIYTDEEELNWSLKHIPGISIIDKLETYFDLTDPKKIIEELILCRAYYVKRAYKYLRFGRFTTTPTSEDELQFLIDKILWKLGFDVGLYPGIHKTFWSRLEKFYEIINNENPSEEHGREGIRSIGVNFFVSLEQVLDYSLSFITWVLLGDHYDQTRFKFDLNRARFFMAKKLNEIQEVDDNYIEYDVNGKNTLYPLIKGFSILSEHCMKLLEMDSKMYHRKEKDIPVYKDKTNMYKFPFIHKKLIFDLRKDDLQFILQSLVRLTFDLEKNMVSSVRNRIEHKRDDFPTYEELKNALDSIKYVFTDLQEFGIFPLVYLYSGNETDKYGRSYGNYFDYKNKHLRISNQNQYVRCRMPKYSLPQIIMSKLRIKDSVEPLRFVFLEESEYTKMWNNFPSKKLIDQFEREAEYKPDKELDESII